MSAIELSRRGFLRTTGAAGGGWRTRDWIFDRGLRLQRLAYFC